ncbi:GlsB/YeaQ/YmgE family stress response membrane protein [Rhizobium sp. RCC_161_2]|uniref:GlsB/YeaQ/YmgE family stress response membrane protein n=1 Tax=Rhizobium sp. RCC_161_2 TaxID=3239219 RepID=UPI0035235E29
MEVGWIAAIIIGGLAGWFAEMIMKSNTGIIMNIVLGIVGALVASWLFGILGIRLPFDSALINYLITGFIGACILIFVGRLIRR